MSYGYERAGIWPSTLRKIKSPLSRNTATLGNAERKEGIANEIMDITHSQTKVMMKNQENIMLSEKQCGDPESCSMDPVDMKLHHKEMSKRIRLGKVGKQKEKERREEQEAEGEKVALESTNS